MISQQQQQMAMMGAPGQPMMIPPQMMMQNQQQIRPTTMGGPMYANPVLNEQQDQLSMISG